MSTRDLEQFARDLKNLSTALPEAMKPAARDIAKAIDDQFENGTDPYGVPWEPLAKSTLDRGRHPPPLTDTRETRESVDVQATGDGVFVHIGGHADKHQKGGPNLPVRETLPTRGLPETWYRAIARQSQLALKRRLAKAAAK